MKTKQTKKESIVERATAKRIASEKSKISAPAAETKTKAEEGHAYGRSATQDRPPAVKSNIARDRGIQKLTPEPVGIKKESKSDKRSKVTFRLPAQAAPDARKVTIVGDFNNWNREATPLRRLEDGDFAVTLELDSGREYRFRYLIDGQRWENDWRADKYVKSPFGVEDSVVAV